MSRYSELCNYLNKRSSILSVCVMSPLIRFSMLNWMQVKNLVFILFSSFISTTPWMQRLFCFFLEIYVQLIQSFQTLCFSCKIIFLIRYYKDNNVQLWRTLLNETFRIHVWFKLLKNLVKQTGKKYHKRLASNNIWWLSLNLVLFIYVCIYCRR